MTSLVLTPAEFMILTATDLLSAQLHAAYSGNEDIHMGTDSLSTENTLNIILSILIFIPYMSFKHFLSDACTKAKRCDLSQLSVSCETHLMSNHRSDINIVSSLISHCWELVPCLPI